MSGITTSAQEPEIAQSDAILEADYRDWIALLKPRVMTLVVFTGAIGLLVAPGHMHPVLGLTAILCIAVGAGAVARINMWYDRDIDAIMRRTRRAAHSGGPHRSGERAGLSASCWRPARSLSWAWRSISPPRRC